MKSIRFLAAGAALLLLASCGKEYNSVPGGNKGDNPLLPLGTADVGQIRYNRFSEKIRIYNAYRSDSLVGTTSYRRVIGLYTSATDGRTEAIGLYLTTDDTVKKAYTSKDSFLVNIAFQDAEDVTGTSLRIYSNQVVSSRSGFRIDFSELNATTMHGSFSGRLIRQFPTEDSNDLIEIYNGTFWVKK